MYKIIALSLLILFSGCSFKPDLDMAKNTQKLPESYNNTMIGENNQPIDKAWWKAFEDPTLDALINEAFLNNSDLLIAAANVAQARAAMHLQNANQYPTINAEADASRQQASQEIFPQSAQKNTYNNWSLSGVLNYEIDIWGKLANQKEAAESYLKASEATRDSIKLALASDVASNYFSLLATREQVEIAKETMDSWKNTYDYYQKQLEGGAISELTLNQSQSEYENSALNLEILRQEEKLQLNALKILVGKDPAYIMGTDTITDKSSITQVPKITQIPGGLPSELLERRPDIKAAIENIKAANASIGAARADYFPTISLTGAFGGASEQLKNLFTSGSQFWNIGGTGNAPILDFGRVSANVESAKAQKELAILQYQKTVKQAFSDIDNAITSHSYSQKQAVIETRLVSTLEKQVNLAKKRYDEGYSSFLEVMDAQRGLYDAQQSQVSNNLSVINSTITLYKALGGGWTPSQEEMSNE